MKSKGKIYKRYLYQAKYVIKGKKLKTSTAMLKRNDRKTAYPKSDISKCNLEVDNSLDFEIEDLSEEKFSLYGSGFEQLNNNYSESVETEKDELAKEKELLRIQAEELKKEQELLRIQAEELKKVEELQKQELARKMEELRQQELKNKAEQEEREELEKKAELLRQQELQKQAEELKKAELLRQQELQIKAEELKKAEEAKKLETEKPVELKVIEIKAEDKKEIKAEVKPEGLKKLEEQNQFEEQKKQAELMKEKTTGTVVVKKVQDTAPDMQSEIERLRLLELARAKQEKLDQEKKKKAEKRKEEKLSKSLKSNISEETNLVNKTENKIEKKAEKKVEKFSNEKKSKRKQESKSFAIVAALLAVIIVAGIVNIGDNMVKEIKKDNLVVGEVEGTEEKDDSLLENLGLFDATTEPVEVAPTEEQVIQEDTVPAIDSENRVIATNTETKAPTIKRPQTNIMDYVDSQKPSNNKEQGVTTPPVVSNPEIETGGTVPSQEPKVEYIETLAPSGSFELYKTNAKSISKFKVIAGNVTKYTKHTVENGNIKINKADAEGLWFIIQGGEITAKFAYAGGREVGIAEIILMEKEDDDYIQDDIIYVKQGSTYELGGKYVTKDDEGNVHKCYTKIDNAVGKMLLYEIDD